MTPIYRWQKKQVIITEDFGSGSATNSQAIVVDIKTSLRELAPLRELKNTRRYLSEKVMKKLRKS